MEVPRKKKKLSIDFSGVPYMQLGYQEYQCYQGKYINIGKKQKYHSEEKSCYNARPLFSYKQTYDLSNKKT